MCTLPPISDTVTVSSNTQSEVVRKRHYRTGLNIFNKKPEKGVAYLIKRGFLENSPQHVARFLITRKGLSKQMIGLYLGNLQYAFNMAVLECFANELDFAGLEVMNRLKSIKAYIFKKNTLSLQNFESRAILNRVILRKTLLRSLFALLIPCSCIVPRTFIGQWS